MNILPYPELRSFKEIDELHDCPKGTAFRAFKRHREQLQEGKHYCYLGTQTHPMEIETLRRQGRIYVSTVNAVLLTEAGYAMLEESLPQT